MPADVLEENSRQMDRHKKRLVFRTWIGNSEVCAEVHALQSGGDGAPESEMGLHSSARYLGAIPCKDLYTITQILNNTRRSRSNQWRSSCRMLVNPLSNFRVLVITRAAALSTQW